MTTTFLNEPTYFSWREGWLYPRLNTIWVPSGYTYTQTCDRVTAPINPSNSSYEPSKWELYNPGVFLLGIRPTPLLTHAHYCAHALFVHDRKIRSSFLQEYSEGRWHNGIFKKSTLRRTDGRWNAPQTIYS